MLFNMVDTMPLASNEAARCADCASAVGETKLALTAIVNSTPRMKVHPRAEKDERRVETTAPGTRAQNRLALL